MRQRCLDARTVSNRDRRSNRAGFTLLEMFLVLGLVVALSAVLWPMVPNMTEVRRLHRVTEDMRALLSGLHLRAIQEGEVFEFGYLPATGQYRIKKDANDPLTTSDAGDDEETVQFNSAHLIGDHSLESIRFAESTNPDSTVPGAVATKANSPAAKTGDSDGWTSIKFFPDGLATHAQFALVDEAGARKTILVRGLTGTVHVLEEGED